jgi:hypothetical protein
MLESKHTGGDSQGRFIPSRKAFLQMVDLNGVADKKRQNRVQALTYVIAKLCKDNNLAMVLEEGVEPS